MKIIEFIIKSNLLLCFILGLVIQANFVAGYAVKYFDLSDNMRILLSLLWLAIIFGTGVKAKIITFTK